jgi:hypothetical protein
MAGQMSISIANSLSLLGNHALEAHFGGWIKERRWSNSSAEWGKTKAFLSELPSEVI